MCFFFTSLNWINFFLNDFLDFIVFFRGMRYKRFTINRVSGNVSVVLKAFIPKLMSMRKILLGARKCFFLQYLKRPRGKIVHIACLVPSSHTFISWSSESFFGEIISNSTGEKWLQLMQRQSFSLSFLVFRHHLFQLQPNKRNDNLNTVASSRCVDDFKTSSEQTCSTS